MRPKPFGERIKIRLAGLAAIRAEMATVYRSACRGELLWTDATGPSTCSTRSRNSTRGSASIGAWPRSKRDWPRSSRTARQAESCLREPGHAHRIELAEKHTAVAIAPTAAVAARGAAQLRRLGIDLGKVSNDELDRLKMLAGAWPDDGTVVPAAAV